MVNSHGGDLNWAKTQYAGEILDFSVNCNPLGTPPEAVEAARSALSDTGCYPDPACTELRAAIARMDGTDPDRVFCGSGAAEVIFRLALSLHPRTALLTVNERQFLPTLIVIFSGQKVNRNRTFVPGFFLRFTKPLWIIPILFIFPRTNRTFLFL